MLVILKDTETIKDAEVIKQNSYLSELAIVEKRFSNDIKGFIK